MTPEDGAPAESEEGRALSPRELDIADDDHVTELESGRYVISAGDGPPAGTTPDSTEGTENVVTTDEPVAGPTVNERAVHEWLTNRLEATRTRHGFDVTTKVDGAVARKRMRSDDVVGTFDALLEWYADQVDEDLSAEAVLGILLAESGLRIRYPSASLRTSLARYDLGPEDSIAHLLDAVEAEGGMVLLARDDE